MKFRELTKPENATFVMNNIAKAIKKKKITQEEVAVEALQVTRALFNDRLKCRRAMTISEYIAVCDYLGVPYDEFFKKGENE